MDKIVFKYEPNDMPIEIDGDFVDLTAMWRAAGSMANKRPADWFRVNGTTEFIRHLATLDNIPEERAIDHYWRVSRNTATYTLAHWHLAMAYGRYLSPAFHVWCNNTLRAHFEAKKKASEGLVAAAHHPTQRVDTFNERAALPDLFPHHVDFLTMLKEHLTRLLETGELSWAEARNAFTVAINQYSGLKIPLLPPHARPHSKGRAAPLQMELPLSQPEPAVEDSGVSVDPSRISVGEGQIAAPVALKGADWFTANELADQIDKLTQTQDTPGVLVRLFGNRTREYRGGKVADMLRHMKLHPLPTKTYMPPIGLDSSKYAEVRETTLLTKDSGDGRRDNVIRRMAFFNKFAAETLAAAFDTQYQIRGFDSKSAIASKTEPHADVPPVSGTAP